MPPSLQVGRAFAYYYGVTAIPDAQVVNELLGVPTYLLHQLVEVSAGCAAAAGLGWALR